jgi:hypothetical protein
VFAWDKRLQFLFGFKESAVWRFFVAIYMGNMTNCGACPIHLNVILSVVK